MKKLLLILIACFFVLTVAAQNKGIHVDKRIYLTGNQWHYDNLSILEANETYYMVITPQEYYYDKLEAFDLETFLRSIDDEVLDQFPYVYKNTLGWYVRGKHLSYFCFPNGKVTTLYPAPLKYANKYYVCRKLYIDISKWHWYQYGNTFKHPPRLRKGCKIDLEEYKQIIYMEPPYFRPKYNWFYKKNHR